MLLKKLRPSIWLPSIMVAWGIVVSLSHKQVEVSLADEM